MTLIGIPLRKPAAGELTAAAVMAVGLWIACIGVLQAIGANLGQADAGALLLVIMWACVSARIGIRIDHGQRHFAAYLLVSGALLAAYEGVRAVVGS